MAYSWAVKVVWDEAKNLANQRKHGVSFQEARVLFDERREYLEIFDEAHSDEEDRFLAVGPIEKGLVLVVYTTRDDEDTIRIISARWASKREKGLFRNHIERGAR